jgi:hypothetical protein
VLPNCDDSDSKNFWLHHGWRNHVPPSESLFDLVFDPNETNNLASSQEHQSVLYELRSKLSEWMRETQDPLLAGLVAAPPGARITDADEVSNKGRVLAPEELPGPSDGASTAPGP